MPDRALKVLQEVFNLRVIRFMRALLGGVGKSRQEQKRPSRRRELGLRNSAVQDAWRSDAMGLCCSTSTAVIFYPECNEVEGKRAQQVFNQRTSRHTAQFE